MPVPRSKRKRNEEIDTTTSLRRRDDVGGTGDEPEQLVNEHRARHTAGDGVSVESSTDSNVKPKTKIKGTKGDKKVVIDHAQQEETMDDLASKSQGSQSEIDNRIVPETTRRGNDKPSAASQQQPTPQDNKLDRIAAILSHRKFLLKIIQQSKSACRKRLDSLPPSNDEVGVFRETCRLANSLARKQPKREGPGQERKSSLSLRRGSSVGKKMNDALSSLAPDSGTRKLGLPTSGNSTAKPILQRSASMPVVAAPIAPTSLLQKMTAPGLPPMTQSLAVSPKMSRGVPTSSKPTQQPKEISPPVALQSARVAAQNPQLQGLREQRANLRKKLLALYEQRRRETFSSNLGSPTIPSTRDDKEAYMDGNLLLSKAPSRRRKTHWDTVLQEMQWLATDFLQERKRKEENAASVARSLSKISRRVKDSKELAKFKNASMSVAKGNSSSRIEDKLTREDARLLAKNISLLVRDYFAEVFARDKNKPDVVSNPVTGEELEATRAPELVSEKLKDENPPEEVISIVTADQGDVKEEKKDGDFTAGTKPERISHKGVERKALFQQISDRILAIETKGSVETSPKVTPSKPSKSHGLKLSNSQLDVVDAIEEWWDHFGVGTVIQGTQACGKTILACSLLWRSRSHGLQVVICSASSIIRWGYELNRFKGLNVLVFEGDHLEPNNIGKNDVILCEHSAIFRLCTNGVAGKLVSLIIDCRHPAGFEGSRVPSCLLSTHASTMLSFSSAEWWNSVATIAAGSEKRLIIENLTSRNKPPRYVDGLHPRQTLEILSSRTVLLLGDFLLNSSRAFGDPRRFLLSWARQRTIETNKEKKKKKKPFFDLVRKLLLSCVEPLHFCLSCSARLDNAILQSEEVSWELRLCKMTELQKREYTLCCKEVQAALSRGLVGRRDQPSIVSRSMSRLRRCCSHSELNVMGSVLKEWIAMRRFFFSVVGQPSSSHLLSPSQTFADAAARILEGSGKFQALMSLLINDCGIECLCSDKLSPYLRSDVKLTTERKSRSKKPQKIVILASLSDLQIMISLLLSHAGINHHVLMEPLLFAEVSDFKVWTDSQLVLSDFNEEFEQKDEYNIVISSADTLGSDHGGLKAESADLVICIDEDWSGRGELLLYSLLSRSIQRRSMDGKKPCRFIRLVSESSCEAVFLPGMTCRNSSFPELALVQGSSVDVRPFRLHPMGWFDMESDVPADEEFATKSNWGVGNSNKSCFLFPASNILSLRGANLRKILSTDVLPPLLTAIDTPSFLPFDCREDLVLTEIKFVCALLENEDVERRTSHLSHIGFAFTSADTGYLSRLTMEDGTHFAPGALSQHSIMRYIQKFKKVIQDHGFNSIEKIPIAKIDAGADKNCDELGSGQTGFSSFALDPCQICNVIPASTDSIGKPLKKTDLPSVNAADGYLGQEVLAFFPPYVRGLSGEAQSCEINSMTKDVEDIILQTARNKRAFSESSSTSKRPRLDCDSNIAPGEEIQFHLDMNDSDQQLDLAKDDSCFMDLGDDVALVGNLLSEPLLETSDAFIDVPQKSKVSPLSSSCVPKRYPCPAEMDTKAGRGLDMNAVIVFVPRKRSRRLNGRPVIASDPSRNTFKKPSGSMSTTASMPIKNSLSPVNGITADSSSLGLKKRSKKKLISSSNKPGTLKPASSQQGLTDQILSFKPIEAVVPEAQLLKPKDFHKKTLLSAIRQSSLGATLFESASFRSAYQVVKKRVEDRLGRQLAPPRSSTKSTVGFHPHHNHLARMANLEQDPQREAIYNRSRLAYPGDIDFGPFHTGFSSLSSRMSVDMGHSRVRPGLSLPMGVKLAALSKEYTRQNNGADDRALRKALERYPLNFSLAASLLRGNDEFCCVPPQKGAQYASTRYCQDRWNAWAREEPIATRQRELDFPDDLRVLLTNESKSEIIEEGMSRTPDEDSALMEWKVDDSGPGKRSFSAIEKAKARFQRNNTQIPGITVGSDPSIGPPTHASHTKAVQDAVVAFGTTVAKEMWPLQLLAASSKNVQTTMSNLSSEAGSRSPTGGGVAQHNGRVAAASYTINHTNNDSSRGGMNLLPAMDTSSTTTSLSKTSLVNNPVVPSENRSGPSKATTHNHIPPPPAANNNPST